MTFPLLTLEQAEAALSQGKAVVLPTDTVYGVGVAVCAAESPRVLFKAKGRPDSKPVAWLVADADALDKYGADVPAYARQLAQAFWPGALTLVVRASDAVPPAFQSADGTIGLRMPASPAALALIFATGSPLAVTSANLSGKEAPATLEGLDPALISATAGVLAPASSSQGCPDEPVACGELTGAPHQMTADATCRKATETACPGAVLPSPSPTHSHSHSHSQIRFAASAVGGVASTVVDCTGEVPRVLRPGALDLEFLLEGVGLDKNLRKSESDG